MLFAASAVASSPMSTQYFIHNVIPSIWERFVDVVAAPFSNPGMLWITLPLVITLLMMEFYFGRYRSEELGWNTAVGNSLVLVFVSLDLVRQVYGGAQLSSVWDVFLLNTAKTVIAVVVGFSGLLIFYTDFFHLVPKWFAFDISSPLAVNFTAYLSIVFIYTNLTIDVYAVIAALLLLLLLVVLFAVVHYFEPKVGFYRASGADRALGVLFRSLEKGRNRKAKRHLGERKVRHL